MLLPSVGLPPAGTACAHLAPLLPPMQLKCVFLPGTYTWGAVYQFRVWQKPGPGGAEALALVLPPFTAPNAPR